MQLYAINFHINFPHTFQHGKWNANVAFHPFVDKWRMLIPFATYLQLFYKYFTTSLTNIICNYFIHPFDKWIILLYFITYLQLFYN